ncbi:MAG TPA: cytochrome P450 [Candidatus Aquilonibacter sp.]
MTNIPGPSLFESTRRLYPTPFRVLPQYLAELTERYGDIVTFALPSKRFVLLNHPEQIKDVLVTQQHRFVKSLGARTLRLFLGDGLLTSEEPHHRQMRRIVQPAFHRARIEGYARTMHAFADAWAKAGADGERIDMHAAMSGLTLRIASETLFGTDSAREAADVRAALHAILEAYPSAIGPIGSIRQQLRFLPGTRAFNAARAQLDRIIYALIAQRRSDPAPRSDALSLLLEAEDSETGYHLSDEQVRDEAMTLFLAGHETTANALTWTWYLLAQHPEIEARLHAEVDAAEVAGDLLAYAQSLDYTRRVLRESMRLYPPAWIIGREAHEDVTLTGGYRIAAGTTVFVCPLVLHRRAKFYEDPQRFDPDRWLRDDVPAFAYLPFGGGARRCIGEEFAWTEGTLALAAIARTRRFERLSSQPAKLRALVTLRPDGPMWMRSIIRAPGPSVQPA